MCLHTNFPMRFHLLCLIKHNDNFVHYFACGICGKEFHFEISISADTKLRVSRLEIVKGLMVLLLLHVQCGSEI